MKGEDLEALYRRRFEGREDYRQGVWSVLTRDFFNHWIEPAATVLDLGCGYCEFINSVQASRKFGIDLNPEARIRAGADVEVLEQDTSLAWPLADGSIDVVFTSNFFEHLPDKAALAATVQEAHRCLKPGGRMISMGPNVKYLPGAYWDFLDHHIPLTEKSVSEALVKQNFSIELCIGRFLPFTMSNEKRYPLWTLTAYLRIRPLWRLFGRQFLVIARK